MTGSAHVDTFDHHRGRAPLLRATRPWRWALFLAINLIGFAAVNAFWLYLSTGQWVNFSPWAYQRDLAAPVGRMLLQPLSVFRYPWMILASGLMLAVVIFVPVIVSVLYRLPFAAAFVLAIAVIGHAPVLALAVGLGCILAGRTSWRSDMPFLATLLGLLPVGVYLALGYVGVVSEGTLPLQRWILMAPFLVALILAALAGAAVLALARVTSFRPGVVWPVLAALLAGPIAIFHAKVGPDELDYALLANWLPKGESLLNEEILQDWARRNHVADWPRRRQEQEVQRDLERRREEVLRRCRRFLNRHAHSPRAPEVLWVAAQCQSLQVHQPALEQGLIRHVTSHLLDTPACRRAWRDLRQRYPQSQQAALADWHLGELALRGQARDEAARRLAAARGKLVGIVQRQAEQSRRASTALLAPLRLPRAEHYRKALFEVDRLLWLMMENADALEALAAYLAINPNRADHAERLGQLAETYQRTRMADNLKLAVILTIENPYKRAESLIPLANVQPLTDAAVEANYELGRLGMLAKEWPGIELVEGFERPQQYFERVRTARPNPWQSLAEESLAWLETAARSRRTEKADETEYALLTGSLAGSEAIFEPVILEFWAQRHGVSQVSRSALEGRVVADLWRRRREMVRKCGAFLAAFPTSRRARCVAWLAAQCESLQLHESALKKGLIKYETSYVLDTAESRQAWQRLRTEYAGAPQSALAEWHLGELALRRREVAGAKELLQAAEQRLQAIVAAPDAAEPRGLLPSDIPTLEHYRTALFSVRRLIWLMTENADAIEALAELLKANPYEWDYHERLSALARAYEPTSFGDNLKLALAQAADDHAKRAVGLVQLAERDPSTDAAIEAMYELGRLAMRTVEAPAPALVEGHRKSEWYFRQVQAARPNPWQPLAAEHLASIAATTRPHAEPGLGEEDYAAILNSLESAETIFRPVVLDVWVRSVGLEHLPRPKQRMRARFQLEKRRRELVQRCEEFVFWYPHSLHAPKVLWLTGRVQSLQLDEPALQIGLIKYGADHLRDTLAVRRAWRRLLTDCPNSRQAALARGCLGELAARRNEMPQADQLLRDAAKSLENVLRAPTGRPCSASIGSSG